MFKLFKKKLLPFCLCVVHPFQGRKVVSLATYVKTWNFSFDGAGNSHQKTGPNAKTFRIVFLDLTRYRFGPQNSPNTLRKRNNSLSQSVFIQTQQMCITIPQQFPASILLSCVSCFRLGKLFSDAWAIECTMSDPGTKRDSNHKTILYRSAFFSHKIEKKKCWNGIAWNMLGVHEFGRGTGPPNLYIRKRNTKKIQNSCELSKFWI